MTYDYEVTLIKQIYTKDSNGNQIPAVTEDKFLCGKKSTSRSEFYNAAAAGLRPELILVVHAYEYAGQKAIIFEGIRYKVVRTYATGIEEVELTCERDGANG
ncbi:MAG TPA: phage head closure protein [Negativicutes bacterium]|nr:phage head closure protein [Negativicutes bacterium]